MGTKKQAFGRLVRYDTTGDIAATHEECVKVCRRLTFHTALMRKTAFRVLLLFFSAAIPAGAFSQTEKLTDAEVKALKKWLDKQEKQTFFFGVSLGIRTGFGSEDQSRAVAVINPSNQKVDIEYGDLMSFLISTSVTAFPIHNTSFWGHFGFTANVNLIEFSSENTSTVFNKSIDGGIGFAYAIDKEKRFAVALTYERTSVRCPKQWVINQEGQQISVDGAVLTNLDTKDDNFFTDRGLNAVALKFIYHFN